MREGAFAYNKAVNQRLSTFKDSIPVPSDVYRIKEVAAYLDNGDYHKCCGYLSLYNEKTNEQLLNTHRISNDKQPYKFKKVDVLDFPHKNNLNFVLRITDADKLQECRLVIFFK